jgi:lipopolysaccharide assembly outer membrane protein LptD (OstA)
MSSAGDISTPRRRLVPAELAELAARLAVALVLLTFSSSSAAGQGQQVVGPEGTTFSDGAELIGNCPADQLQGAKSPPLGQCWRFVGNVEMELRDTRVYATEIWYYIDEKRVVAAGNVVFSQGSNRIAADRAEVDTETQFATFYNASGFASVQEVPNSNSSNAPQLRGQETDVYFFGETIEKIGPKKYRITNGGFSTCVQPTPRWEISAGTLVLNVDDYTLLRQAIFKVKGVPLLYIPILYYPTTKEDRATGILLPTYGMSSARGQTISNAFFWAINRSHDATLMHDWFSKAGQGYGGEYRYALAPRSEGSVRAYVLNQNNLDTSSGGTTGLGSTRSFEIRGGVSQRLGNNLQARARADYFSSPRSSRPSASTSTKRRATSAPMAGTSSAPGEPIH